MSEFISVCPKCQQRILGDTEYVGKRVACPICMQEIIMPEPSHRAVQAAAPAPEATGRRGVPMPMVASIVAIVILAAGVGIYVVTKKPAPQTPALAVNNTPPPANSPAPIPVTQPTRPVQPAGPPPGHASPPAQAASTPSVVPAPTLAPGHYKIINRLAGLTMDVVTNTVGTNTCARAILGRYDGTQIWDIRRADTNYSICILHGPSLQLAATRQNGAQLELAKWVHVPRQLWDILPMPDGGYEIRNATTGGLVDVLAADAGQPVVQDYHQQDGLNQQWLIQAP